MSPGETSKSTEISLSNARPNKLFYVVANVAVVDAAQQACLLLKRSGRELTLPGIWALPGGKLDHNDVQTMFQALGREAIEGVDNILAVVAFRETLEECGLRFAPNNAHLIGTNNAYIRPDGVPALRFTFATTYQHGSVRVDREAFSDHAWVTRDTLPSYNCTEGARKDVLAALDLFCGEQQDSPNNI